MAMTAEERSFVTTAIVSVAVGLTVLGVGFELLVKKEAKFTNFANPGDTPVVLVGGTLTFKSGAQASPPPWQPVPGSGSPPTGYFVDPGYAVAKIVVKKNAPGDDDKPKSSDAQPASDRLSVDVSDAGTWEIDAYAITPGGTQVKEVATLTPKAGKTEIDLNIVPDADTPPALCPVPTSTVRIGLGHSGSNGKCPDDSSFHSVILKVDGAVTGTFNCTDANSTKGHCRIVLRGPPSS